MNKAKRKDPPADALSSAAAAMGRKGGKAKVPKGTAMLPKKERTRRATEAAKARWGKQ